jgi:hypothetical protein
MGVKMIFESSHGTQLKPLIEEDNRLSITIETNPIEAKNAKSLTIWLDKRTAIRLSKHLRFLISEMED